MAGSIINDDNEPGDALDTMDAVPSLAQPPFPVLTFDPDAYRALVAEEGWSPAQEDAYLSALWSIIVAVVDLGWQIHPTQQVLGTDNMLADPANGMLDSSHISDSFNHCTAEAPPLVLGSAPQNRTDS